MPKYRVSQAVSFWVEHEIEADSEKEAKKLAWDAMREVSLTALATQASEYEWEFDPLRPCIVDELVNAE